MHRRLRSFVIFIALMLAGQHANSCDNVDVVDAWIREPPPVANVAGGYVSIRNNAQHAIMIVKIESTCCDSVAMHRITHTNDSVAMSPIEELKLVAGETAVFEPGAMHLMLHHLNAPITEAESIDLTFFCATGESITIPFPVRRAK